jgi:predicted ATPase
LLRVQLSVPLIALHGFGSTAVEQCALQTRELSDALGVPDWRFAVLRVVWNSSLMRRPHRPTYALACELMAFAEQDGDPARLAVAHRAKGYSEFFLGRYADGAATLGRGIELAAPDIPPERYAVYGEHPAVLCRVYRAWALAPLGQAREAAALAAEAVALARGLRSPHAAAWALCCEALVHAFLRDAAATSAPAEEALQLAITHRLPQWRAWSTFFAGWARTRTGEAAAGIAMMEEGAAAWRATGAALSTTLLRGLLAEAHAAEGNRGQARAHLDAAFAHHDRFDEAYMLAELHRIDAAVRELEQRPADEIRQALARALQVARAQGVVGFAARAACARATFERAQGRRAAARDALEGAIAAPADGPDLAMARTLIEELAE